MIDKKNDVSRSKSEWKYDDAKRIVCVTDDTEMGHERAFFIFFFFFLFLVQVLAACPGGFFFLVSSSCSLSCKY